MEQSGELFFCDDDVRVMPALRDLVWVKWRMIRMAPQLQQRFCYSNGTRVKIPVAEASFSIFSRHCCNGKVTE